MILALFDINYFRTYKKMSLKILCVCVLVSPCVPSYEVQAAVLYVALMTSAT
jgi:hypothetical protein